MNYSIKEPLIQVRNLSKSFGDKMILKDFNFEIRNIVPFEGHQGQIIAILARSGRGKSTLLRLITGLEIPTTGSVKVPDFSKPKDKNEEYHMKDVAEGEVGFVDQKYTLFRHKTVYQALLFAMRANNMENDKKSETIHRYLKDWGLEACKDQYPNELSGGQRQRTAILEQILSSSHFLVLDEPFSGLDVGNIKNVKNAFKLIDKSSDLNTIIFSTHDIGLAVLLADTIFVLGNQNDNTSVLLKTYDLKTNGLAWKHEMTIEHYQLVDELTELLLKS
jgi:ABC-type nitrate/sulfonate/bicarbonate transport system ATPase subunit